MAPPFGTNVANRGATFQFPGRVGSSDDGALNAQKANTHKANAQKANAAKGKRAQERNRKDLGDIGNTEIGKPVSTTTAKRPRADPACKVTETKKTAATQKKKQCTAAEAVNGKKAAAQALRLEQYEQDAKKRHEAEQALALQQARTLEAVRAAEERQRKEHEEQTRDRLNAEWLQKHQQQLANKRQREVVAQREMELFSDDSWKAEIQESKRYREAKRHSDDPQDMVEYRSDIIRLMNENENLYAPKEYIGRMLEVTAKNRMTLVDWLLEVHFKFKMEPETLYLAISMLDRYLCLHDEVRRTQLQLCGGVCLMIASKFQEVNLPMTVSDVCYIMDQSYNATSVKDAECQILQALNFRLIVPSPHAFLTIFAQMLKLDFKDHIFFLASFFLDCTLLDVCFLRYTPRQRAAASLFLAFVRSGVFWTPDIMGAIGFPDSSLREWAHKIESSYKQHQKFSLYKKYERPQTREIVEFYNL